MRNEHPDKEIRKAISEALLAGWRLERPGASSHAYGRLLCPGRSRDGCRLSIWRTPRNCGNHARQIRRRVKRCEHGRSGG